MLGVEEVLRWAADWFVAGLGREIIGSFFMAVLERLSPSITVHFLFFFRMKMNTSFQVCSISLIYGTAVCLFVFSIDFDQSRETFCTI